MEPIIDLIWSVEEELQPDYGGYAHEHAAAVAAVVLCSDLPAPFLQAVGLPGIP